MYISSQSKPVFSKQQLSIEQTGADAFGYRFEVKISRELSEELVAVAAPFLQNLALSIEKRKEEEKARLGSLHAIRTRERCSNILGLKVLKIARTHNILIPDVVSKLSISHNLSPENLKNIAEIMQKRRTMRMIRFRDRQIRELYRAGMTKSGLAKEFQIPIAKVKVILQEGEQLLAA